MRNSKKKTANLEQIKTSSTRNNTILLSIFGFVAIIAVVLFYGVSTYLPYAKHKDLITVKNIMIKMAIAENNFHKQNKQFATTEELFNIDQSSLEYNGYEVILEVKPDLSSYTIKAQQLDSAKIQYPNCNKLVVTPKKYFSYDAFGEISTGCW
jgi:Tfp pilus assembly protein PilE